MRKSMLIVGALAVLGTSVGPVGVANAKHRHSRYVHHYRTCTHSGGTTGLVVGGVAGALLGGPVLGHGALGTVAGAAGGALGGRAIDRSITAHRRCR